MKEEQTQLNQAIKDLQGSKKTLTDETAKAKAKAEEELKRVKSRLKGEIAESENQLQTT